MDFQKVVVATVNFAVCDQSFDLLDHGPQVIALVHIVHVESVLRHVLDEILRGITVISGLQWENPVLLDQ